MRFKSTLGLAFALAWGAGACGPSREEPAADAAAAVYYCPMHPTYTSERPGTCPVCGMDLVRQTETPDAGAAPPTAGRAGITLSTARRQLLGVESATLEERPLSRTIRTVGRVAVDERRLHHVHAKFEAYVEHLHVDFTGKFVRRGEPLLSLYSPELVATQQEYLLAWRAQKELAASGIPSVARGGADLLEAARQRLLLWDIRVADIERLEATGEVKRTLDLHSDVSGYVVQKMALHGMRVTPADTLFDIADLSYLWVLADVYESDLPLVRLGMQADVSVAYLPDQSWRGPVTYVFPTVEEKTRTVKVRIEVANPDAKLKPDMFADVELAAELGRGVVLPESAVIRTGDRQIVFVDRGEGRLEPREVRLGTRVEGGYQVLAGVAAGDSVVVSANFLVDSESSLKAALQSMARPSPEAHAH